MVTTSPTDITRGLPLRCFERAHAETNFPMGLASSSLRSSGRTRSFFGNDSSNSEGELPVDMYAHSPGNLGLAVVEDHHISLPFLGGLPSAERALVLLGDRAALLAGPFYLHFSFFSSRFLRSSSNHSSLPRPGCRMVRPILLSLGLLSLMLSETILARTLSPSLSSRFVSLPMTLCLSTAPS